MLMLIRYSSFGEPQTGWGCLTMKILSIYDSIYFYAYVDLKTNSRKTYSMLHKTLNL